MLCLTIGMTCSSPSLRRRWPCPLKLTLWSPAGMTIGLLIRSGGNGQQGAWDFLVSRRWLTSPLGSSLTFRPQFIFLSPVAFLAQLYVLLSRLSTAIGPVARPCLPLLSPRALGWVFVSSDLGQSLLLLLKTQTTDPCPAQSPSHARRPAPSS